MNLATSGDNEHLPRGSWWEQRISKKPPPKQQECEGVQHLFFHHQNIAWKSILIPYKLEQWDIFRPKFSFLILLPSGEGRS